MKRYVFARLDKNRIKSDVDKSRANHLFNLMNEQEELEQRYYDKSAERYNRAQVNKYAKDFKKQIEQGLIEINEDIASTVEEYGLDDAGIWYFINEYLGSEQFAERDDGLTTKTYKAYDDSLVVILITPHYEKEILNVGIVEGTNYGDPNDANLALMTDNEGFNALGFCDIVYDLCENNGISISDAYDYGSNLIEDILGFITEDVHHGIEKCLEENPPALG